MEATTDLLRIPGFEEAFEKARNAELESSGNRAPEFLHEHARVPACPYE